jgi:hypothetical protein
MPKTTYRIVTRGPDGGLRIRDLPASEFILQSHIQIGVDDCSTDLELAGLPVFRGLVGPMPEGKNIIRYESPEVFESLTKESERRQGRSPYSTPHGQARRVSRTGRHQRFSVGSKPLTAIPFQGRRAVCGGVAGGPPAPHPTPPAIPGNPGTPGTPGIPGVLFGAYPTAFGAGPRGIRATRSSPTNPSFRTGTRTVRVSGTSWRVTTGDRTICVLSSHRCDGGPPLELATATGTWIVCRSSRNVVTNSSR